MHIVDEWGPAIRQLFRLRCVGEMAAALVTNPSWGAG